MRHAQCRISEYEYIGARSADCSRSQTLFILAMHKRAADYVYIGARSAMYNMSAKIY